MAQIADKLLDVTGAACPIPVLKAAKALRELPAGALLEVLATDPGARADFEALCRAQGHTLVECNSEGRVERFLIRNKG